MKNSQLKHFCTHALTDLVDQFNSSALVHRRGVPDQEQPWGWYLGNLIVWLRQAQKFSLTEDEARTVPPDIIGDWITDKPRLPFQFTAIEVDPIEAKYNDDLDFYGAVFMCAELQAIDRNVFEAIRHDLDLTEDTEGFLVWPIMKASTRNWQDKKNPKWVATPSMAIMLPGDEMADWVLDAPNDQKHQSGGREGEPYLFVQHLIDAQMVVDDLVTNFEDATGKSYKSLPKNFAEEQMSELMQQMGGLLLTQIRYVAAMNVLLNTKNVEYRTHPPVAKLNHKRKKKGKELFYEYKTLKLYPDEPEIRYVGTAIGQNPLHRQSPKLHMRRGHVRRLHNGGTTFVRQSIIGQKRRGLVLKDYQIEPGKVMP